MLIFLSNFVIVFEHYFLTLIQLSFLVFPNLYLLGWGEMILGYFDHFFCYPLNILCAGRMVPS